MESYSDCNSYFLGGIDPIFKIFKNILDGSSGSFGTRLFRFSNVLRVHKIYFPTKELVLSCSLLSKLVSPKSGIIGFGSHVHVH